MEIGVSDGACAKITFTHIKNDCKKVLPNFGDSPIFSTNQHHTVPGQTVFALQCTGAKQQAIERLTSEEPDEV
jgi:hypothetical protein